MTQPDASSTIDSPWLAAAEPVDESITMPQTLAGVFDEAFDLYKRHFGLLAMIVAAGLIPTEIIRNIVIAFWLHPLDAHLSGVSNANADSIVLLRIGQFFFGEPRWYIWPGVLAFLVLILLSAPISVAVSDLYFGRETTARDCYRRSRSYIMSMMWGYCQMAMISIGVAAIGLIAVSIVGGLITMLFTLVHLPEVGLVLTVILMLVPYGFWGGIIARSFLFVTPLAVLEGLPVTYVPYRNNQLIGKKRFWRSWAAVVGMPIVWTGFLGILYLATRSALDVLHLPPIVNFIAVSAFGSAIVFFMAPYPTIFFTLLYYDYRVRREGFDVRVLSLANPEKTVAEGAES